MRNKGNKAKSILATVAGVTAFLATVVYWQSIPGYEVEPGFKTVEKAFQNRQSDLMIDVSGQVVRLLKDQQANSPRQRFVIRLVNGQNLEIAHNLENAERLPLKLDDQVNVRGEYHWTQTGGKVQWTHRDSGPDRRHGWIHHKGQRYD